MLLGEALDDLSKGKYKESLWSSCIDWMIWQITIQKHSISTQGILVFKTRNTNSRRQNDSGSLFRHQRIQRNHVARRGD
jgi:hypothetical protein